MSEFVVSGDQKVAEKRRAAAERQERLEQIDRWVREGRLVIREMTADERRRYPPARRSEKQGRRLLEGRVLGRVP